jgi:hypothetical protein
MTFVLVALNRRQQRSRLSLLLLLPPVVDFKPRQYCESPIAAHAEARSGPTDHVIG